MKEEKAKNSTNAPYLEHHFENAEKLIRYLSPIEPDWQFPNGDQRSWIFRGQCNAEHRLLPRVWRLNPADDDPNTSKLLAQFKVLINDANYGRPWFPSSPDSKQFITTLIKQKVKQYSLCHILKIEEFLWQIIIEMRLVHEFIKQSNLIGLQVPSINPFGEIESVHGIASKIEELLKKWSDQIKVIHREAFDITNFNDFACLRFSVFDDSHKQVLALAQHHGVPTRLLDWTRNPFIAAFFAVDNIDWERNSQGFISVWALETSTLAKSTIEIIKDFRLSDLKFLHAQNGVFTYSTCADGFFLKHGKWLPFDDPYLLNPHRNRLGNVKWAGLKKMTLPINQAINLLNLLEQHNISGEFLKPSYSHVADYITKRWLRE